MNRSVLASLILLFATAGIQSPGAQGPIIGWGNRLVVGAESLQGLTAVAASALYSAGLHADGSVAVWGAASPVPAPNTGFVAVAAGAYHSLGLKGSPPTPAQSIEATADVRERDVLLRWRTPFDGRVVSFHVYRGDEIRGPNGGADAGTGGPPLPAGVYYAVLRFNERVEGKRIIVVQ
jgi:hypothetical protein